MSAEALAAKNRGNAAFQAGRYEEAASEFTTAISLDASNHVLYSNRSGAYAALKQYDHALEDANKCIELNPNFVKGYSRKGLALFNLGRYEEARDTYRQGLTHDANNQQLKDGLAETEQALNQPGPRKLFGDEIWAKLATNPRTAQLLNNPAVVQKIKMVQANPQMLSQFIQDPAMMEVLSVILGIDMRGADAGEDMPMPPRPEPAAARPEPAAARPQPQAQPAESKSESKAEAPVSDEEKQKAATHRQAEEEKNKGNALYKQRKFDEAIAHYTRAFDIEPTNSSYLLNRAAAHLEKKDFDSCVNDCKEAIRVSQEHFSSESSANIAKAYARMATAHTKQGDLEQAIHFYQKSLIENNVYEVRQKLKEVEAMKKKKDEENYLNPELSAAANQLGKDAFTAGRFAEAISHYTEAIRRNPVDAKLYSNRAACYTKLMDWGHAMADCDKCLELDPTFIKAYIRKGKIQHCIKEYHKAMATFEEAARLDPNCTDLIEARNATREAIAMANATGQVDPERQQRAMADPEIQKILKDPTMMKVLQDLQTAPQTAQAALRDPHIRANIEKLVAAGIIQVG
eukprot:TRINITY_DN617_c0_g2_i1.p1 TRINITY_DN617_c0_g2~~TRINITY_DN617_c0_g2_i1.p1  ORF type:complete len:573 (-),score=284.83 TRINITY_DN617_c0_g2_i1:237-1955(-)